MKTDKETKEKPEWELIERHETMTKKFWHRLEYQVTFVLKNTKTGEISCERAFFHSFNKLRSWFKDMKYIENENTRYTWVGWEEKKE